MSFSFFFQLKSGESCVSSGNSTEDEKDLPRDTNIKTEHEVSSRGDMSSYYFSSHMHPRDGAKPRGRPTFSHRSKSSGDKRGRGTNRPAVRPVVRERDPYPDRNTEFDPSQQRKNSHHFQRHSSEISRHSGRYGSPVRNARLVEDSEERKLSPASEPGSKRYQQIDENKTAKVISHRRDAPREKQRLTQDLARQKRLLSEDIARAELLQREQLTKKFVDIFDNKKDDLGTDRAVVEVDGEKVCSENCLEQLCHEGDKDCSHSMYERCYGDHSSEYNNEHTNQEKKDIVCKLPVERESLFDRFICRGTEQEMKNIEFVNESKVEVKGIRYKNNSGTSPSQSEEVVSEGVQCKADIDTNRPDFEPLKFENVSDDEVTFSDADTEKAVVEDRKSSDDELKTNGGSPTFPKIFSTTENGLDSASETKCNGSEENCDSIDSPSKTDLFSKESLMNNLGYVSCECPSEDENSSGDDKTTKSSFMCDSMDYLQTNDPDHSSIKSSKIARLMDEPDMQCEHSSKHGNDYEPQKTNEVSSCGVVDEINNENDIENENSGLWNHHPYGLEVHDKQSTDPSKNEWSEKETKNQAPYRMGTLESKAGKENFEVKEFQGKGTPQNISFNVEQNSENVADESELSNMEGMSDAGELSEPAEGEAPVSRGKIKKKKRKKTKSHKNIHKPVLNNPRRKYKANKARPAVKDASSSKAIKQLNSESDDDTLRSKNKEVCEALQQAAAVEGNGLLELIDTPNACNELMTSRGSPSHGSVDKDVDSNAPRETDSVNIQESGQTDNDEGNIKSGDRRSLFPNEECYRAENAVEEVVAMRTVSSDNYDSAQELNADPQRNAMEEDGKREQARKEKRIGKTKRKSDEKERDRERTTPPHLISQNRYARDLPRHNWLVERLLQQKKLCAEDTLQHAKDTNDEQDREDNQAGKEDELSHPGEKEKVTDKESTRTSPDDLAEKPEVGGTFSPKHQSDHEDPASSPRDGFQNELHKSFLRRSFPPSVPKTLPRLKPSSPDCIGGNESGFKSIESKPPPPPLKHALPSKEASGLEPLPKLRKIVDDKGNTEEPQDKEALHSDNQRSGEPATTETEQPRKVISPIEILDDDEEKKKRAFEDKVNFSDASQTSHEHSTSKSSDSSLKEGRKSPIKSLSGSSPDRVTYFSSAKKPFGAVNPTIPGMKDKFGRPMHMPPHRAAILIPVVPMHDGNGMPISPGLGPTSPHLKGYSPRTFTPHLLTHSAAVPGPGMFGNPLSQAGRYPATNCGHHVAGNMKSGIPCKRDVNCPFHGNNPRGIHPGILDIPSHHGPMHAFGPHSNDHFSAVMSRERRECDKGQCRQPDCQVYQADKQSPPSRDTLGDKSVLQTPKVVKPVAHVPGKRPPLMLSHLQQIGKHSPSTLRELEALHEEKARRFGGDLMRSPHQLQKSPEGSPRELVVPNIPPLYERRPLHQPLTLSDLNRRREEEMLRVKVDEGLKSKTLPGELMLSGLPSPSRGPAKLTTPPHSKDPSLISPGRGSSSATSPVDKRDQTISLRRLVEEREPSSIMSEFLKPGPPRLRSIDEGDVRLPSERLRREELSRVPGSSFVRMQSAKDAVTHSGKLSDGNEGLGPRGIELLGKAGRLERDRNTESLHGNSNIVNPALRLLDDRTRQNGNREGQRSREHLSPEAERRLRLELSGEHKTRSRSLEKDPRMELRDKERPEDRLLLRAEDDNSRSRVPFELSPPLRHKVYPDRPFLTSGTLQGRIDPRMAALHELEMHRRGEVIRASEPSHRELLSRMASSLPVTKGGSTMVKSIFVRPDGSLERRGPDSTRLPSEVHVYSPPTSLASREYGLIMNSRQAMERLAAAAGKPESHVADVGKDLPPHIKQVSSWRSRK